MRNWLFILVVVFLASCSDSADIGESPTPFETPAPTKSADETVVEAPLESSDTDVETRSENAQIEDLDVVNESIESVGLNPAPVYANFKPVSGNAAGPEPIFLPLGWSESGHFGVIEIREDDGRGGFSIYLKIVDMVSDDVLFDERELDWDHEAVADTDPWSDSDPVVTYFLDFWGEEIFNAGLAPWKAETIGDFRPLPIEIDGISYFAMIDKVYGGDDSGFDNIEAYDFWLRGTDETMKRVYSASPRAIEVVSGGYFLSPFEPRAAIVIIEERYSFEGTEPFAVLTGSDMKSGFESAGPLVEDPED